MNQSPPVVTAPLGFVSAKDVTADAEREGLLRASPLPEVNNAESYEFHDCKLTDCTAREAAPLNLHTMGFDRIDLSSLDCLQSTLQAVRRAGEIDPSQGTFIRRALRGQVFSLSNGYCLRMLTIAGEGLIMRKAGPDGWQPESQVVMSQMNGHDAAIGVHGDQDVRGTPLKQLMRGVAPRLFRHQTPDGSNLWSPVMLVNLWIPLDQITRPLTLMDRRTLDGASHQLRYALPTDDFLERENETRVNDIWTFLYHPTQSWHFSSYMDARSAYVFDTLGAPHGSTVLPGEAEAAWGCRQLRSLSDALHEGNLERLRELAELPLPSLPEVMTLPLKRACVQLFELIEEARVVARGGSWPDGWVGRASAAIEPLIRKSIEMRVVALVLPDRWPFNRAKSP
ncbi:MAG: hypothetical protein AAGA91_02625 [Pseudomonadota bacterium]